MTRTLLAAALFAAGVLHAQTSWAQVFLRGSYRLTQYWITEEDAGERTGHAVRLTDRHGGTLAWVCPGFASSLAMEGTGRTANGRLLNWDARVGGHACFVEMDATLYPYGAGVQGWALVPYRSLAVDGRFIPLGHTVELPELRGMPLPDGTTHDGCFVAVDGGGAIRGHHIDLFLPSYSAYTALGRARWLPREVSVVVDAPRCRGALRYARHPIPGDAIAR